MSNSTTPDSEPGGLTASPQWWRLGMLTLYWAALFLGTHRQPGPSGVFDTYAAAFDKLLHFLAYAGLAWLLAWACQLRPTGGNWRRTIGLWLLVVAYGALDETTQLLVGRSCHLYDWLADVAGATVGMWIYVRRNQT